MDRHKTLLELISDMQTKIYPVKQVKHLQDSQHWHEQLCDSEILWLVNSYQMAAILNQREWKDMTRCISESEALP